MTLLPSTYRNNLSLQGRPDSLEAPMRDSDAAKGRSSVQKTGRLRGSLTTAWSAPGSPHKVPKMQAGRLRLPRKEKQGKELQGSSWSEGLWKLQKTGDRIQPAFVHPVSGAQ